MRTDSAKQKLLFTNARLRLRARTHGRVGDHRAAATALQAVLDRQPDDLEAALRLALHYVRSEQRVLAARTYLRAAEIYAREGQRRRALDLFDQACKFGPLQVNATRVDIWARALGTKSLPRLLATAQLLIASKRAEQALGILQLAGDIAPFDLTVIRPLVGLEIALDQADRAEQRLHLAIERLTATGRTANLHGIARLMVSRFPRNILGLRTLATIYVQRAEARRALPLLLAIERRRPSDPSTPCAIAKIHAGLGDRDLAIAALERFIWVRSAKGDMDASDDIEQVLHEAQTWSRHERWHVELIGLGFGCATASRLDLGGAELTMLPGQPPPTPLSCRRRRSKPRSRMLESAAHPVVRGELRVG